MLLTLENSVIGERLKGLYATLQTVSTSKGALDVVSAELTQASEVMAQVCKFDSKLKDDVKTIIAKKDDLMEMNVLLMNLRAGDQVERSKQAIATRDKVVQLQAELSSLTEEKESAAHSLEKTERKMKEILDENQRLRQKMKNNWMRRKANEATDQICRVCQKMYNEAENFNWSCRTHFGDFGGEMWWCCGKPGREAPGCKVTKHVSKEDDDPDSDDSSDAMNFTIQCSSCKEIGHKNSECPKDPNIRSKQDLENELKRIRAIKERKKLMLMGESQEVMKTLFEEKFGKVAFGTMSDDPSDSSSDQSSSIKEKEAWEVYLERFRRGSVSRQSLFKIDNFAIKEPNGIRTTQEKLDISLSNRTSGER